MKCACVILLSVACLALLYFSTLCHKLHDLKKKLFNIKCLLWLSLQLSSEKFLIQRIIERDTIKNVYWYSCKVFIILVRFQWDFNFLDRFSKNTQVSNAMKIRPVGAEMFHANRGTDRHEELIFALCNFANSHNKRFF